MQISIKTNFPDVQRSIDALASGVREKALASALNRTVEQGRTQMVREITSEYAIKSSEVREKLRLIRATFRQGAFSMRATLSAEDRRRSLSLARFMEGRVTLAEMRRRKKAEARPQLRFRIKRGGPLQTIPGAFVATANGGTFVARRVGKARYPIQALSTIGVPQMFNQKRINATVVRVLRERFPDIAEREIRYYVDRFNRKGGA